MERSAAQQRIGSFFLCSLLATNLTLAAARAADAELAEGRLDALTSKYEEQQHRLAELEAQAAQDASVDVQRTAAMRAQIRQILSEREFRENLAPATLQAGYDKGFYVRSTDDAFSFKVNGAFQFRFTHYGTRARNHYLRPRLSRDDRTGVNLQRLRITFSGQAFDPNLTYSVTLRADAVQQNDLQLHFGYVNYKFVDEFQVRVGRFRLASTRAQILSDTCFQFVDRPMVDAVFGLDVGTGVRFWGQCANKRVEYMIDVVNSLNGPNNRVITNDPSELDSNPAFVAKAIWHALGDQPDMGTTEGDLEVRENPALDIGAHYAFNEDDGDLRTTHIPFNRTGLNPFFANGGFGLSNTNGARIHQVGLDSVFKWHGFSLQGEYIVRFVDIRQAWDHPFAPLWRLTGEESTTAMHGGYLQAGYFLPIPGFEKKLEFAGRVVGIRTNVGGPEGAWEYTGAVNYYIDGHRVKLNTEVSKVSEAPISNGNSSLANVNDDVLMLRVQFQVLF